jgi:hypothetical protein
MAQRRNMKEGKEEGDMTVRYARFDGSGKTRSDVQLDNRACECCTTGMVMVDGRPVIVYRDRSSEEVRSRGASRMARESESELRAFAFSAPTTPKG